MSSLLQEVAKKRESYLEFLREGIRELSAKTDQFAVELLVKPNGWDSPHPFCLCRVDLIYGGPEVPKVQRFVDKVRPEIPILEHRLESGLVVSAGEFGWEEFTVAFESAVFTFRDLEPWLSGWLDPDETKPADEYGLSGVVHSIAWNQEEDRWRLHVDFGSAEAEALAQLLDVLAATGIERCELEPPTISGGEAAT